MKYIKNIGYIFISTIAVLMAVGSILSLLTNTDYRYLKMLDFPRIQFFLTSLISLVGFVILTKKWKYYDYLLVVALAVGMVIQGSYLINYTPLVDLEVPTADVNIKEENKISLLLVNVKVSNRKAQPLIDLLQRKKADLIVAMEVNEWWENAFEIIEKDYPYAKESINDLGYGMTLYSKYPLKEISINYLNNEKVPSFSGTITLDNGQNIRVHTVHPPPPLLYKDVPDNEGQKEAALLEIGDKVIASNMPSIVAGDFNDVAWSKTNAMTKAKGQLNDVRVGRGFYNSYDTGNIFMRWPLDHIFVTKEFSLHQLERMPDIGSDHYPIYAELILL